MIKSEKLSNLLEQYPFITQLSKYKALSFYDLETTGIDTASDRIVEFCAIKLDRGVKTQLEFLVDPLMDIPESASDVHGITKEVLVKNKALPFKNRAQEIYNFLKDTVLITFNGKKFDIPLLICEFDRVGMNFKHTEFEIIDVWDIYIKMNSRTLKDAFEQYVGRQMLDAHKASADVEATMSILEKQIETHSEFQNFSLRNMIDFASYTKGDEKKEDVIYLDYSKNFYIKSNSDSTVLYGFGKNKGLPALSDRQYLKWVSTALKDDKVTFKFMPDTRRIATNLLLNGKP